MKKFLKIIHSAIWWFDFGLIVLLGIFFDYFVWPKSPKMHRAAERFWAWTLMKIGGVKLEISGQENMPKDETVVYMANHQSHLDWPIIFMAIPGQYLFLAKKELFDIPVFGTYLRMQKYIPIDRSNVRASWKTYQNIIDLIKAGNSIVLYPEGTRSSDGKLQRFKTFSFYFLKETRVKVVLVAIEGSRDVQRGGSKLISPGVVKVKILPQISFDDLYHLDNKEFSLAASKRAREALLKALEEKVTQDGGQSEENR